MLVGCDVYRPAAINQLKVVGEQVGVEVYAEEGNMNPVEIAKNAGIMSVIQPGGSIKDQLSIDYCDAQNMSMVFTGIRHFKH